MNGNPIPGIMEMVRAGSVSGHCGDSHEENPTRSIAELVTSGEGLWAQVLFGFVLGQDWRWQACPSAPNHQGTSSLLIHLQADPQWH